MENLKRDKIIKNWANKNDRIKNVWIYGSRVKDNYSEDSDLDIAIQIESRPFDSDFDIYTCKGDKWQNELENLLPFKIDLQRFADKNSPVDTPEVRKGVCKESKLIYRRSNETS